MKAAAGKGRVWGWGRLGDTPTALAHKDQRAGSPGGRLPHARTIPTGASLAEGGGSAGLPGDPTCSGLLGSGGSIGTSGAEASGGSAAPSASSSSSPTPPPLGTGPSGEEPGRDTRQSALGARRPGSGGRASGRGPVPVSASLVGSRRCTARSRHSAALFGSFYFLVIFLSKCCHLCLLREEAAPGAATEPRQHSWPRWALGMEACPPSLSPPGCSGGEAGC